MTIGRGSMVARNTKNQIDAPVTGQDMCDLTTEQNQLLHCCVADQSHSGVILENHSNNLIVIIKVKKV